MRSVIASTFAAALILTGCQSSSPNDQPAGVSVDSTGTTPSNSTGVGNGPSMGRAGGNGAESAVPVPDRGGPSGGTGTGSTGGAGNSGGGAGGAGGGR